MNSNQAKTYLKYLIIAFVVIFLLRLVYQISGVGQVDPVFDAKAFEKAPVNFIAKQNTDPTAKNQIEWFEKKAQLVIATTDFDDDYQKLSQIFHDHKANIQYEKLNGLNQNRSYLISAGIDPDSFDVALADLKAFNGVKGLSIQSVSQPDPATKTVTTSLATVQVSLIEQQKMGVSVIENQKIPNQTYRLLFDSFTWSLALTTMLAFLSAVVMAGLWLVMLLKNRIAPKARVRRNTW